MHYCSVYKEWLDIFKNSKLLFIIAGTQDDLQGSSMPSVLW